MQSASWSHGVSRWHSPRASIMLSTHCSCVVGFACLPRAALPPSRIAPLYTGTTIFPPRAHRGVPIPPHWPNRYHRLRNELEELSADLDTAAKDTSKANTVAKARTLVPRHRKHAAIWSLQHERASHCVRTHTIPCDFRSRNPTSWRRRRW